MPTIPIKYKLSGTINQGYLNQSIKLGNWAVIFGEGSSGRIGSGEVIYGFSSPVQVGATINWVEITPFSNTDASKHFIKTDGTLWAWGDNNNGAIGDGTVIHRSSPVQIGSLTNWKYISNSSIATAAIKTDGTLWTWGYNSIGTLGHGDVTNRYSPVQVGILTDWKYCSIGTNHTVAVKTDGTLWAWGNNSNGYLGLGDIIHRSSPVQVGNLTDWKEVSCSVSNTFAIKTDGTLWSWGSNTSGRLGLGDTTSRSSPVQVGSLTNWKLIYAGLSYGFAIKTDGTLWAWGTNSFGNLGLGDLTTRSSPVQVGNLTDWKTIGVNNADSSVLAVKTDGTLWAWGNNASGSLGLGDKTHRSSPVQVGNLTNWKSVSAGYATKGNSTDNELWFIGGSTTKGEAAQGWAIKPALSIRSIDIVEFESISIAAEASAAVKTDGTLWAWGDNSNGRLGLGDITNRSSPVQVGSLLNWKQVSLGYDNSAAVKTDGTLWSWGLNNNGQLGLGDLTTRSSPVQVGTDNNWKQVDIEYLKTAAVKTDGTLWTWGINSGGTLGLGDSTNRSSPVQVGNLTDWKQVSINTSTNHNMIAVKTDGTLWSWGNNIYGKLGLGDTSNRSSPVQVGNLTDWKQVEVCGNSTLAIKTNGTLWGWGNNTSGQLGLGDITIRSSPVQVGNLTDWKSVSSISKAVSNLDAETFYITKTDGTLWGLGFNGFGELGLENDYENRSSPVQIGTDNNWKEPFLQEIYEEGIELWKWGYNGTGSLGLGDLAHRSSPVQVGSLTNWKDVRNFTNSYSSLATKTDGTLWAWGSNSNGVLGLGDTTNRSSPVQVGNLTDWNTFSESVYSASRAAIKTDGTLWAWGSNFYGQLGDGTIAAKSSPIQIGALPNWSKISVSDNTTAIKTDGTLWTWGRNDVGSLGLGDLAHRSSPVQVGSLSNWKDISVGNLYSLAIKTDGTLWTWGFNSSGNLGLGDNIPRSSPVQVGNLTNWKNVFTNTSSSYAIKTDGTLWAWGDNINGALGHGDVTNRSSPVQVGNLTNWKNISFQNNNGSDRPVAAIKTDGTLWAWGGNTYGSLGLGDTNHRSSPVQVGSLKGWKTPFLRETNIYNYNQHVIPVDDLFEDDIGTYTGGELFLFGNGSSGELGDGSVVHKSSPVQVGSLTNWKDISISSQDNINTILAIKTDGTLWGWGENVGAIGDGTIAARSSPVQVGNLTNWKQVHVFGNNGSTSTAYTLAIKTDGTLWAWGNNAQGFLGLGDITNRSSPVQVGNLTDWKDITSSAAIKTDGTLWTWGYNANGALGLGDITSRSSPVQVGSLTDWKIIRSCNSQGSVHTLAIKTDGTLWAWGSGANGALGLGDITNRSSPVQVGSLTNWKDIKVSSNILGNSSVAIKTDGTLWTWGNNDYGQLGLGNATNRSSPVQVGNLTDWKDLEFKNHAVFTTKTDGTLWVFGRNNKGQLGLGDITSRSSPVQVGTDSNWKTPFIKEWD